MERKKISLKVIQQMYFIDNLSQQEIARRLNVSQWAISNRMRNAGLKSRARTRNLWKRKYRVDEAVFKKLSPKAAWVLGWLMSDGYISKNRVFGLKVAEKDADIV